MVAASSKERFRGIYDTNRVKLTISNHANCSIKELPRLTYLGAKTIENQGIFGESSIVVRTNLVGKKTKRRVKVSWYISCTNEKLAIKGRILSRLYGNI